MDVWNSRPLDVHRWSDYSEVNTFIGKLWDVFSTTYPSYNTVKRGPKPKSSTKNQFKVVVLDLYVCWLTDPDMCIGFHRNRNNYESVESRYNKLHIKPIIIELIDGMIELGWLEHLRGHYNHDYPSKNHTSRIKAAGDLLDAFVDANISIDVFSEMPNQECIILNGNHIELDDLGKVVDSKIVREDYEDTPEIETMRSQLLAYNKLLHDCHIDIADLATPCITRTIQTKEGPEFRRVRVNQASKFVRRIFSNSCWNEHGRFYGGFWQRVDEDTHSRIYIDHHDTIEVDFKALHVNLIYAKYLNAPLPTGQDPYELDILFPFCADHESQRACVKKLVLQAINASSLEKAYGAFRNESKAGSSDKRLTNKELGLLIDRFLWLRPELKPYLGTGMGLKLMYLDGQITAHIINHLTNQGIPLLTVHDSYIVKRQDYSALQQAMALASSWVTGHDLYRVQDLVSEEEGVPYDFYTDQLLEDTSVRSVPTSEVDTSEYLVPCSEYESRYKSWRNRYSAL